MSLILFSRQEGIDLRKDQIALSRILEASEQAKIELSSQSSTIINLPFIYQDVMVQKFRNHLNKTKNE